MCRFFVLGKSQIIGKEDLPVAPLFWKRMLIGFLYFISFGFCHRVLNQLGWLESEAGWLPQQLFLALFNAVDKPLPQFLLLLVLPIVVVDCCCLLAAILNRLRFELYDLHRLGLFPDSAVIVAVKTGVPPHELLGKQIELRAQLFVEVAIQLLLGLLGFYAVYFFGRYFERGQEVEHWVAVLVLLLRRQALLLRVS